MKKLIPLIILLFIVTGCKNTKKDSIIGEWETNYEVSVLGSIVDKYNFKENNECEKTITYDSDVKVTCTYEFNDDKTQIKISWDDKMFDEFVTFERIDKTHIKIGEYVYEKK
nr:hypothetical protein [Bacilli bacterium]